MISKAIKLKLAGVILVCLFLNQNGFAVEEVNRNDNGEVWWGEGQNPPDDPNPIHDIAPPQSGGEDGKITFWWTNGFFQHPDYAIFSLENTTDNPISLKFYMPQEDPTITDWVQVITDPENGTTVVASGNIQQNTPWEFHPLADLPLTDYRIPDLAPTTGGMDDTIFCAVNLGIYFLNNPDGFLNGNWTVGQTLNDLGISIVDGIVDGSEGIYWATTNFTFDPDSERGFLPAGGESAWLSSDDYQEINGDIEILAIHQGNYGLPVGACAIDIGCISHLTEYQCLDMGGQWQGEGSECVSDIPTLSEWGMIILALLLLSAGTVAVIWRRKTAMAMER